MERKVSRLCFLEASAAVAKRAKVADFIYIIIEKIFTPAINGRSKKINLLIQKQCYD